MLNRNLARFSSLRNVSILASALTTTVTSCRKDDPEPPQPPQPPSFTLSNGGITTGTTSTGRTAAPAGYTWSENMVNQGSWGWNATHTQFAIADDFTVPTGEKWTIENFYTYAYKTYFSGSTLPMSQFYIEIYSSNPSMAGATKIYGDQATNRYVSNEEAKVYRILKGLSANTDRKVFKIKAQTPGLTLTSGTYWIKWSSHLSDSSSHYYVNVTPSTNPALYNALSNIVNGNSWESIFNGAEKVDMAFELSGKKTANQ